MSTKSNGHEFCVKLDLEIKADDSPKEMQEIRLVAKRSVKNWADLNDDKIELKRFTEGLTNRLYGAIVDGYQILVRIYGNSTDKIIDREAEMKTLEILYKIGVGPQIFVAFKNGYSYEYFEGKPLSTDDLTSGIYNDKIGNWLGSWHRKDFGLQDKTSMLWTTIEKWFKVVPKKYSVEIKQKRFEILDINKIHKELPLLREELNKLDSLITFCHNDLLGPNILYEESKDRINFIDYEYAAPNFRAYDIANHFNEWCGFDGKYQNFPKKKDQMIFLTAYLKAYNQADPTQDELEDIYIAVNKFTLASHFYWGTWALVQADISDIDFDFMHYAGIRFDEYWATRDELFALQKA